MSRAIDGSSVELQKNFHDEKEWRFIPQDAILEEKELNKVSFSKLVIGNYVEVSNSIEAPSYEGVWLKFDYDDIKYIIVPDQLSRENVIQFICDLPAEKFSGEMQRNILISKILVLDDIRKDW